MFDAGSSLEDSELMRNPNKFGVPTFEEFCRNPEKFTGRWDQKFQEVDRGSQWLGKVATRHIYEVEGTRCRSLEEVERVAKEKGIDLQSREYDYRAVLIPQGGGTADILVKFMRKADFDSREEW
jgi:hypothetical protein